MITNPSIKCNHVWIEGAVDFGISYTNQYENIDMFVIRENWSNILESMDIIDFQHCAICYLEKYIREDKTHYKTYWQKELRLNREMMSAYYRQLRESDSPMHYRYFIFWKEKSVLLGENFSYRNRLPDK